jgi:hypothetical protein
MLKRIQLFKYIYQLEIRKLPQLTVLDLVNLFAASQRRLTKSSRSMVNSQDMNYL